MNQPARNNLKPDQELISLIATPLEGSDIPHHVCVVPWGEVKSANGQFVVDDESARVVIEAFDEHGCDLPVDYEHQTLGGTYASPTGQAPAAGWIKRLTADPGFGIIAHVRWTEPAARQLADRQYRYLSPVAIVRKSDRKLVGLHSVALTNKPAIVGMEPIVNRRPPSNESTAFADPSAAGAADLRLRLSLDPDCADSQVLLAAAQRLEHLEAAELRREAEQRVAAAVAEGKLAAAQKEWAVRLVLKDESLFEEWLRTAPPLVQPGRLGVPGGASARPATEIIAASARNEFRAHPFLQSLTTEEAYVADAVRQRRVIG